MPIFESNSRYPGERDFQIAQHLVSTGLPSQAAEAIKHIGPVWKHRPGEPYTKIIYVEALINLSYKFAGDNRTGCLTWALWNAEEAVRDLPDHWKSHAVLGIVRYLMGDIDGAVSALDRADELDKQSVENYGFVLSILISAGAAHEALPFAENLADKNPTSINAQFIYAATLLSIGKFDGAERVISHALQLDRNSPLPNIQLLTLYLKTGQTEKLEPQIHRCRQLFTEEDLQYFLSELNLLNPPNSNPL